jgi:hypothetical protein
MRPAESDSFTRPIVAPADGNLLHVVPRSVDIASGVAICAHCGDVDAAPMLAGDRARGPDHLYLVCDRCGGKWQRH